jgi:two-component sensor histidine kinase
MPGAYTDGEEDGVPRPRSTLLLRIEAMLARQRTKWECLAWLISALGAATLLRMAAGLITAGVPLAFYFPAVSVVAIFTGWRCGMVAVAASAAIAWFLFVPPVYTLHPPTLPQGLILLVWFVIASAQVFIAAFLRSALQRALSSETRYRTLLDKQKQVTGHRDIQIGELRHRLKNLLTVIEALAKSSRRRQPTHEEQAFLHRFLGRLHALGAAADLVLAGGRQVSIECGTLVRATLSPFMEEQPRFDFSGPELHLSEETGSTLGLALHELATNALKYGALTRESGRVSVSWSRTPFDAEAERVEIVWQEHGGPPPTRPEKEGFGTRLIRSVAARERDGEVQISYDPAGFSCCIAFLRQTGLSQAEPLTDGAAAEPASNEEIILVGDAGLEPAIR